MIKHVAVAFLLLMMSSAASIRRIAQEEQATNSQESVRLSRFAPNMITIDVLFLIGFPPTSKLVVIFELDREPPFTMAPLSSTLHVRPRCQAGML
jgi:hypothetical protein